MLQRSKSKLHPEEMGVGKAVERVHKSETPRKKNDKTKGVKDSMKHVDAFYNFAPPGLIKEDEEKPEDCIPDLPENQQARKFLSKAPTKGLWMPLGKEVKVMKCWRCKNYGHRTGDKECPLYYSGNQTIESFRFSHEDPMHAFVENEKRKEKEDRIKHLQMLLNESSSRSSTSSSESDSKGKKRPKKSKTKEKKRKRKHSISESISEENSEDDDSEKRKSKKSKKEQKKDSTDSDKQKEKKKKHKKKKHKNKKEHYEWVPRTVVSRQDNNEHSTSNVPSSDKDYSSSDHKRKRPRASDFWDD